MPHIILECSDNIVEKDLKSILVNIQKVLVEKLPTTLESCKSRVIRHTEFVLSNDDPSNAFVHVTIKILKGRSDELLDSLSKTIIDYLVEAFKQSKGTLKFQISLNFEDLPNSYRKA